MLEALIRKENSPESDKCRGDVICVKLKEFASWGLMEREVHAVVDWRDEELEKRMLQIFETSDDPPVAITPYKQEKSVSFGAESLIVTETRSSKYFDLKTKKQKNKTAKQIKKEFNSNKKNAIEQYCKKKPVNKPIPIKKKSNDDLKILQVYVDQLESYGVKASIVDNQIVTEENFEVSIKR